MRILAIGNSFSQDATAHLEALAEADGQRLEVLNLYIGGCSLMTHWENALSGAAAYEEQYRGTTTGTMLSIDGALARGPWDVIILQQASGDSGLWESYEPYLAPLAEHVRRRAPGARLWIHQTWAYEVDSDHPHFARYDRDQGTMYRALTAAYDRAAACVGAPLIPTGALIQRLRACAGFDYPAGGLSLCRDGFHLDLTYGRYAAAALWYGLLTGRDAGAVAYRPHPEAEDGLLAVVRREVSALLREEKDR